MAAQFEHLSRRCEEEGNNIGVPERVEECDPEASSRREPVLEIHRGERVEQGRLSVVLGEVARGDHGGVEPLLYCLAKLRIGRQPNRQGMAHLAVPRVQRRRGACCSSTA